MSLKPPKLTNDCFALPRGVAWIPVDEALNRLKKSLHRITEIEKIPTNVAEGRILAISPRIVSHILAPLKTNGVRVLVF